MSQPEPQKMIPTPKTDVMMRPRSPRPVFPNKDQRTRLRARSQIRPITDRRILNYYCFPNLADELHEIVEAGGSFSGSDTDEDSDYELPPMTIHREGNDLPKTRIKWYSEGEKCAARELEKLPRDTAFLDDRDEWFGFMVIPKDESASEDDAELDSPSRQLREELSQMSQSESPYVDEDDDSQPIITPTHDKVMLFVTREVAPTPAELNRLSPGSTRVPESYYRDVEQEHERKRKRERDSLTTFKIYRTATGFTREEIPPAVL
ncbi:unnamed protein product [Aureobasidium vineae]|uniref:Uncharacterized protein n=1 Tax=Aureobasidium vineae TaxID=2773715 RepID=A0A9N8JK26_9PEZI|nr:unnamed protein product [Aureobasidium vineae]